MSQDEFTKLYIYMEKRFDKIERRLEDTATKKQVDDLANAVDGLAGLIKDYQQEMLMIAR